MRIDRIELDMLLPRVFRDASCGPCAAESRIWLRQMEFRRGDHYLVEAGSGTGKSSLCSFIYGNRDDYDGTIRFDGEDIRSFSIDRWCGIRRDNIALLPQEMRIFPELTAMDNVMIKNRLTDYLSGKEILDMFDMLGISSKTGQPAGHLSIGQQQRVAIIRALCQPFDFIILDEPVSHLDLQNNRLVASMIAKAASDRSASVISTSVGNPLLIDQILKTEKILL